MYDEEATRIARDIWHQTGQPITKRIAKAIADAYLAGYRQGKDDTMEAVRYLAKSKQVKS